MAKVKQNVSGLLPDDEIRHRLLPHLVLAMKEPLGNSFGYSGSDRKFDRMSVSGVASARNQKKNCLSDATEAPGQGGNSSDTYPFMRQCLRIGLGQGL